MAGGIAAAVPAALFAAAAGTALHRQQWLVSGVVLPWGAVAALVLLGAVQLLLGAAFRSVIPTAASGVVCYVLTGLWSNLEPGKRLIAADLPGYLWIYGSAGVTVLMLLWCRRYRRRQPPARAVPAGRLSLPPAARAAGEAAAPASRPLPGPGE
jgi:N-acetyl-1-D-myo-inositol-2-amino-2-deoxy-alpha-D-glucopyranoside deacetylase